MTGRELYEELVKHGAENQELVIYKENGLMGEIEEIEEAEDVCAKEWKVVLK